MFNYAIETEKLPDTLEKALITVLLKPGKDPLLCLSLLNTYILAKLIALRPDKVPPDLVDMDQTGFVRNRSTPDNIRRLFNIMRYVENDQESVVAASLDAEKAFDRIEWNYLFEVLHRMNIGPKYVGLIRLLYKCPAAQVLTNGNISSQFSLSRGTRQGCPASPLLFFFGYRATGRSFQITSIHPWCSYRWV